MEVGDSMFDSGLVVPGGYSGGGMMDGWTAEGKQRLFAGVVITVVVIVLIILLVYLTKDTKDDFTNFYGQRFAASKSDRDYFTLQPTDTRAAEYVSDFRSRESGFVNSREGPYFPDATNRVLRMENREKEAVRALGKINQERQRRAAEDTEGTAALAWGPFWKEWKSTHPVDGEPGYVPGGAEGFESKGGYVANFDLAY